MSGSNTSTAVNRYASALYALLEEQGKAKFEAAIKDVSSLKEVILSSADLQAALANPTISKDVHVKIMEALLKKLKISGLVHNFVLVVIKNRRLSELTSMLAQTLAIMDEKKGLAVADVTSAHALSAAQVKELEKVLSSKTGKTVSLNVTIDASVIGGLIVKIGSQMIDASIKTRLNSLKLAMQEAA